MTMVSLFFLFIYQFSKINDHFLLVFFFMWAFQHSKGDYIATSFELCKLEHSNSILVLRVCELMIPFSMPSKIDAHLIVIFVITWLCG